MCPNYKANTVLNVIGYWVPHDDPPPGRTRLSTLSLIPARTTRKKNWDALHADPVFLPYRNAAVPLIEKVNGAFHVDEVFMLPIDFSAMK